MRDELMNVNDAKRSSISFSSRQTQMKQGDLRGERKTFYQAAGQRRAPLTGGFMVLKHNIWSVLP